MKKNEKKIIEVKIGFNTHSEKIEYVKSDFLDDGYSYKDPIEYTARLMEMGLEKWIRDNIGIFCPKCESHMEEGWLFCPTCGWDVNK